MLGQLDDLAFRDASDLVQVQTAAAFNVLGLFCRTKESVRNHRERDDGRACHRSDKLPVCEQRFQLAISNVAESLQNSTRALSNICMLAADEKTTPAFPRFIGVYFTETVAGQ